MSQQPAFAVPELSRGRRLTVSDLGRRPPQVSDPTPSFMTAGAQPGFDFGFEAGPPSSSPSQHEQVGLLAFPSSQSSSSGFSQGAPVQQPAKRARYYSTALTDADKDALARGEENHYLKVWTPKDVVMHHESRKALVPHSFISKLDKIDAFAQIENDVQQSQAAVKKKVRKSKLPLLRLTNEDGRNDRMTYQAQASQSMFDLRSSSAPAPQLLPSSPVLPHIPALSRKFSFEKSPGFTRTGHVRAASSGDHPRRTTRPQRLQPSSSPSSGSSSRERSPLGSQDPVHQANPNTTFDAFLVPHKSGKGEVYRGADNAKRTKHTKGSGADTPDAGSSPATDASSPRRLLRKMTSIPRLRKRSSRFDVRKTEDDDVPDVPPLP
ncbi:hypothetical protein FB567DRAFT_520515 [Paraphoma chrysanthemicola]|uniref:Uncharacterized protein n=1 Tax=Paraphoma chrysanthemicola TaxID=798071 RepID=A0A8K0W263_9PLEO|nr:hypothetical protein FB567DRAFT_520515 [Paraphoma chrysanthemicola]